MVLEALIQRVATARGVTFIRNGSEYTAADAATHLRRKLRAADGKITTFKTTVNIAFGVESER